MAESDSEIDGYVKIASEEISEQSKRVEMLLQSVHDKISADYTSVPIAVGLLMVAASFSHIWFSQVLMFTMTFLVGGIAILGITLVFRFKIVGNHVRFGEALVKLEKERQDLIRQQTVLNLVFTEGLPKGCSLDHLQMLLGDDSVHVEAETLPGLQDGGDGNEQN